MENEEPEQGGRVWKGEAWYELKHSDETSKYLGKDKGCVVYNFYG